MLHFRTKKGMQQKERGEAKGEVEVEVVEVEGEVARVITQTRKIPQNLLVTNKECIKGEMRRLKKRRYL